jgi:hypothetical protein
MFFNTGLRQAEKNCTVCIQRTIWLGQYTKAAFTRAISKCDVRFRIAFWQPISRHDHKMTIKAHLHVSLISH